MTLFDTYCFLLPMLFIAVVAGIGATIKILGLLQKRMGQDG